MAVQKYKKLSGEMEEYIRSRNLSGKLPGVRTLSALFSANKITVNKALRVLEEKGVVTIRGTGGTFVARPEKPGESGFSVGIIGLDETRISEALFSWLTQKREKLGCRFVGLYSNFKEKPELLARFPLDGYVFLGSYGSRKIFEYLHDHNIPVIGSTFFRFPWLNRITFDHEGGCRKLLRHLRSLGHRKIALLDWARPVQYRSYNAKLERVFREELGEDFEEDLIRLIPQEKWRDGDYMMKIFGSLMGKKDPPTCLAGPVPPFLEFSHMLRSEHIRIPQDISLAVIGCRHFCPPGFTALEAPMDRLLSSAARLMARMLHSPGAAPERIATEMILRPGKSVADLTQRKRS